MAIVCIGTTWTPGPWVTIANNYRAAGFPPADIDLVEYYNSDLNHYFITANPAERQSVHSA